MNDHFISNIQTICLIILFVIVMFLAGCAQDGKKRNAYCTHMVDVADIKYPDGEIYKSEQSNIKKCQSPNNY